MAKPLEVTTGISVGSLKRIAKARLEEFSLLRREQHFVTAVYISGYAVEALLKCAICNNLNIDELPKIFEYHKLDSLLFYSGLTKELSQDEQAHENFSKFATTWNENWRYKDPLGDKLQAEKICKSIEKWLNDSKADLVPWLKRKIP